MIERLKLPDGQWADQRTTPRNAEYVAIIEAAEKASSGQGSWIAWAQTVGRRMTTAWSVRDEDGKPLPFDDDGWATADPELIDAICAQAQAHWKEWRTKRRPFVTSETVSDAGSEESPSPSETTS